MTTARSARSSSASTISEREKNLRQRPVLPGRPGRGFRRRSDRLPAAADPTGLSGSGRRHQLRRAGPGERRLLQPGPQPNADVLSGNWDVTEKVNTAYIQLNIDHMLVRSAADRQRRPAVRRHRPELQRLRRLRHRGDHGVYGGQWAALEYDEFLPQLELHLRVRRTICSCASRQPGPWPGRAWTTCGPRGTSASTSRTTTPWRGRT